MQDKRLLSWNTCREVSSGWKIYSVQTRNIVSIEKQSSGVTIDGKRRIERFWL